MSFKDVKELRAQGSLEEALTLARNDLKNSPDDIWCKRSLAWVYYDYLKLNAEQKDYKKFCTYLDLLSELNLPSDEKMIFDQVLWQVGKIVNSLRISEILPEDYDNYKNENGSISLGNTDRILYNYRSTILAKIKSFNFTIPSESYSFLLKMYMKNSSWLNKNEYLDFADWWNFENFIAADYEKRKTEDGKPYISLAEQAYINYAKHLLVDSVNEQTEQKEYDIPRIQAFLQKLDNVIETHPEWEYPLYFKAKLFFALNKREEVRDFITPFAKRKRNEFWVWDLLADTYTGDGEKKLACLCKSLSCDAQPQMTVNVHNKLEQLLMEKGFINEADNEAEIIKAIKSVKWPSKFGFKSADEEGIQERPSKSDIKIDNPNLDFYKKYTAIAEEFLFTGIPEEIAAVEFVNRNKKILNFVISKEKSGFFKYDRYLKDIQIGDRLLVRLDGSGVNKFYKPLTVEKTEKNVSEEIMKGFTGKLIKKETQSFGFVGDIFIEPGLLKNYKLIDGDGVTGEAIVSFNKKKSIWGWKAIRIDLERR
ncbi:MAG: hypothetical protein JXB49_33270 [Bacteroidales bacterium]|nr:hypothetical protein [Bacteroidales bacterium]